MLHKVPRLIAKKNNIVFISEKEKSINWQRINFIIRNAVECYDLLCDSLQIHGILRKNYEFYFFEKKKIFTKNSMLIL